MINGYPKDSFESFKGIHQGDPLSPLLFFIVMEVLSQLMSKAVAGNLISGFAVGGVIETLSLHISHLLFANDTLIFPNAIPGHILHLRHLFIWFEVVSKLKVNMDKSEMVVVGNVPMLGGLGRIVGCKLA